MKNEANSITRRNWLIVTLTALGSGTIVTARPARGARYVARREGGPGGEAGSTGKPGSGRRSAEIDASGPLHFDVTAEERWPIRALDPALHVGDVALESYRFLDEENKTLRFTCYDPSRLQDGAQVFVQYGSDQNSRTDLTPFRWGAVS